MSVLEYLERRIYTNTKEFQRYAPGRVILSEWLWRAAMEEVMKRCIIPEPALEKMRSDEFIYMGITFRCSEEQW